MDGRAKIYRGTTSDDQARAIAEQLKALDYALMGIVTGNDPHGPNPLMPRTSAALARMQRQLRRLRIDMEVERRFDTAPRRL